MTRLNGQEKTEIPEIVIHRLLEECNKRSLNPIMQPQEITYIRIREFLRETGYSHFFENIVKIISILTNRPPLIFNETQRQTLINLFLDVQPAFQKYKGNRKNFLSYSYVMFKFCELLGYDDFLPYLPLFRAPQNLISADRIWQQVCTDCKFQFISTDPDPTTIRTRQLRK